MVFRVHVSFPRGNSYILHASFPLCLSLRPNRLTQTSSPLPCHPHQACFPRKPLALALSPPSSLALCRIQRAVTQRLDLITNFCLELGVSIPIILGHGRCMCDGCHGIFTSSPPLGGVSITAMDSHRVMLKPTDLHETTSRTSSCCKKVDKQ